MAEKKDKEKFGFRPSRKLLRILGWSVIALLFLQVTLYFSADFLLRNFLKEKVKLASNNKYEIDFDRFYISLLQRGISFDGFVLSPVESELLELSGNPFYKISMPEISLKNINYLFRKKEFQIGKLSLDSPVIDFFLEKEGLDENQESALKVLQEEIKKSFLGSSLEEIRIKNLFIENADFLFRNFISQHAIQAVNADLWMKDIQLLQMRIPETPFNAEGFSVDLEQFEVMLSDSVHRVKASEIHISSLKQYIQANKIEIIPDLSKASKTYLKINLDDLELTDADINKVFYTSEVEIGKLKLNKPIFDLISTKSSKKAETDIFDLYALIEGLLKSISITDLSIEEGQFMQRNFSDQAKHRIKAERIDFVMKDVYIGPDQEKKKNQFFYSQDAQVDLFQVELALVDSIHWIRGDRVQLSSFTDDIKIEGFTLTPFVENELDQNKTLIEIDIPELNINEANLRKIYNEGILDIREIVLMKPDILLKDVQGKDQEKLPFDLEMITRDFLSSIYVDRLEIQEGSLILDNNLRVRQDSLSFGKINLVLENFSLDESTGDGEFKGIFMAENLQLELDDYALKLSDNLHVFTADKLFLDTKRELIRIDGFSIRPEYPDQIQSALDRYGKTTSLDIYIPQFLATGVDIPRAYFEGILKVKQIKVPSPKINLLRYRTKVDDLGTPVKQQDILDLLTSYFSEVTVDSLILEKGTLNFENYAGDRMRTFSEDNVSIAVKNFHIHEGTDPEAFKLLFSEEVDLRLNNYVFSLAGGKYNILADRISFNTAREEIITSNVRLNPSRNSKDKASVSAQIPSLAFRGVDIEAFLFDNTLSLSKVSLLGSKVNLLINKDFEEDEKAVSRRRGSRDRNLPKTIDVVKIDTVEAEKAIFNLAFRENGVQRELMNTGIDLTIYDFLLDSAKLSQGDIAGFFSGMSMGVDEFWLTLADSIHQITFSKVELDTRNEGILLNNFRVIPKNLSGKPGVPVISAHIPRALIKTNVLTELQSSKDLWLKELRLFRPDIEVFVDEVSLETKEEELRAIKDLFLENMIIDDFEIVEGNLAVLDKNSSKPTRNFKKLNMSLADLRVDLRDLSGLDQKSLLEKDFNITLPNYHVLLKDSLNQIHIGMITLTNKGLKLQAVKMTPRLGRYQYTRQFGTQTDVIQVIAPEILVKDLDLVRFVQDQELVARSISITGLEADIFRDKRYPIPKDNYRFMPQALMKKSGMVVHLDTLQVFNGKISYTEFPEKGMVPGDIYFSELNASLFPFHLNKESNAYPTEMTSISANALLFGEALLGLEGELYFEHPFPMEISVKIGELDLRRVNSMTETNAFARVEDGKINSGEWSFIADDNSAKGNMTLLYNDIKVVLLDERTLEKAKGRRRILTFVINTFAVKSHNPRKLFKNTVSSTIYEPRDDQRFIFNYWWATTMSGLKGSVGLGQPKPPKKKKGK
ncbi:hypothetical protein [Rhodonellum sp.]|uniref:hypothetical protein n=1 Tax=Rhodonellum sp. TaxID=2231180 RepID=UPI002722DAF8|nr:hypothetical protein [Rhodonellum sp.]MDO9553685.1 hypothetical protein [Rhodonellum sp.]